MSSSQTKQTLTLGKNPEAPGSKAFNPQRSWPHVFASHIISCHSSHQEVSSQDKPSVSKPKSGLTTRSSTKSSKYANRTDDLFFDVVTPYIVAKESNSTLVEITDIADTHALKEFLCSYNTDENFPFYGALLQVRKYLQRTFIETCWDTESEVYQKLISCGLEIDKSTVIKGYPSLPNDTKVQRTHIDNLPLKHPRVLCDFLQQRFSFLGEVLDPGFHLDGQLFYGSGYVVLNLNTEHPIKEKLSRRLPWTEALTR